MAKTTNKQSFEDSLNELDTIVGKMEEEQLSLEELISNYERGAELHLQCESFLKSAKQRLEKIAQSKSATPTKKASTTEEDDDIRLF